MIENYRESHVKALSKQSYGKIEESLQIKLLNDLKKGAIGIDDYRKISRSLSTIFSYIETNRHYQ